MMTRTKIICTLGPAVNTHEAILALIDAGMNVARINFSHGTYEEHAQMIALLKKVRKQKGLPLAIMCDTKGPEIRLGNVPNGALSLQTGTRVQLVEKEVKGNQILLTPREVFDVIQVGAYLLFDDGYIQAKVVSKIDNGVEVEILNPGILKSLKSVTLPGVKVNLPAMTEQDKKDLEFACEQDIDWIAASFIRSSDHVLEIQNFLSSKGRADISVMAKIENPEGVQNFDSILSVSQGIMVARGDLGVELPLEEVPSLQKMMIKKSVLLSKPVVTATQMLESMIQNPRPTRAEVSDVANAIYDSSSAVMLSGETSVGRYPTETVAMMKKVIFQAELGFDYDKNRTLSFSDVPTAIAAAAVQTAYTAEAKAIFVFTRSGATAHLISSFRPRVPVIALTPNEKTYQQLALEWGIIPLQASPSLTLQEAIAFTSKFALKHKIVQVGDLIAITTGSPFWIKGTTNALIVERISAS
jgi:pyruvate kinase